MHSKRPRRVRPLTSSLIHKILAITVCFAVAFTGVVQAADTQTAQVEPIAIETMIATGEAEEAVELLEAQISNVANTQGRNSAALIPPLVLRGDAFRELGLYADALESYDDARSIQRRHFGLHDLNQVEVLYREAEAYFDQEMYAEANDRHEYAYSIYTRKYGTDSEQILPGLFKLADWYTHTNNIFTARGLYEKALGVVEDGSATSMNNRVRALAGLAESYRLERFRPSEFTSKSSKFTPRPYGSINHPEHYYAELNNFAKGEEALLELVKLHLEREDPTSVDLAKAKLALADWYLLFEKHRKAVVVYKDIWETLSDTPEFAFVEEEMSSPQILYKPLPSDPERPKRESTIPVIELEGRIEFALTVTEKGKTKKIKQVSSQPSQMLVKATRNTVSHSIYRPAFVDGEPTVTEDVQFVHTFPYYTTARASRASTSRNNASYRSSK